MLRFGNRRSAAAEHVAGLTAAGCGDRGRGGASVVANTATWTLGTVNDGDAGERRVAVMVTDLGAADPLTRVASAT